MEHPGWSYEESFNLSTNRRSLRPQDELVELLWRDGQVVLQSQSHREHTQTQIQDHHQEALRSNTFLLDQETVSWIQYPPDEDPFDDFSSNFFSTVDPHQRSTSETVKPNPGPDTPQVTAKPKAGPDPPQVMPPPKFKSTDSSSGIKEQGKEQYPVITIGPRHCGSNQSQNNLEVSISHDRSKKIEQRLHPNAISSSSGGSSSGCSFGKDIKEMACGRNITTDRKREHIMDTDKSVSQSDAIGNKSNQRSGSMRRSRAAEVHNLSERRRRDRINERMKALQELIPHCTKTDKASILDEAIDYLKSLQLQLQVMCMGNGMVAAPMMFTGVQPPPFIRPVQLPRFPVMDRSAIPNNPSLVCQNPVQNQIFSNRFAIGGFPQMHAASQPVEMLRFGLPAGQQSRQPSTSTKSTDGPRMDH